eukprot:scaffold1638_cov258-Pinguiococcus_pyrenoidosus.AAC.62
MSDVISVALHAARFKSKAVIDPDTPLYRFLVDEPGLSSHAAQGHRPVHNDGSGIRAAAAAGFDPQRRHTLGSDWESDSDIDIATGESNVSEENAVSAQNTNAQMNATIDMVESFLAKTKQTRKSKKRRARSASTLKRSPSLPILPSEKGRAVPRAQPRGQSTKLFWSARGSIRGKFSRKKYDKKVFPVLATTTGDPAMGLSHTCKASPPGTLAETSVADGQRTQPASGIDISAVVDSEAKQQKSASSAGASDQEQLHRKTWEGAQAGMHDRSARKASGRWSKLRVFTHAVAGFLGSRQRTTRQHRAAARPE